MQLGNTRSLFSLLEQVGKLIGLRNTLNAICTLYAREPRHRGVLLARVVVVAVWRWTVVRRVRLRVAQVDPPVYPRGYRFCAVVSLQVSLLKVKCQLLCFLYYRREASLDVRLQVLLTEVASAQVFQQTRQLD